MIHEVSRVNDIGGREWNYLIYVMSVVSLPERP